MAKSTIIRVLNNTGSTLEAGTVVYISGFNETDQVPTIAPADNRYETKMPAIGVVREDTEDGDTNVVKISGPVMFYDTSSVSVNDNVYVGSDGAISFTKPSDTNETYFDQQIGTVRKVADWPDGELQLFPLEVSKKISHPDLANVTEDQHHIELHAQQHALGGGDPISHGSLGDLNSDVHTIYSLIDGSRNFTSDIHGVATTDLSTSTTLATKSYVDSQISPDLSGIEQTIDEHYVQHSNAFDTIRKDLDGYQSQISGLDTTALEHYNQHSEAIQTILKECDGYAVLPPSGSASDGYIAFFTGAETLAGDNDLFYDRVTGNLLIGGGGNVGIGTTTIPHGSVGSAKFAIDGVDSSAATGPHVQYTTDSDDYPLFQQLNWSHDNIALVFDAFYDGAWKSSDAGSNFAIYKLADKLQFRRDNGIAAGSAVTWNVDMVLDTNGRIGIGTDSPEHHLHISKSGSAVISLEDTSASNVHTWIIDDNDNFHIQSRDSSATFIANDYWITRDASGATQHQWRIGNSAKMTMDNAGNVGIGTDSPDTKLHIEHTTNNDGILLEGNAANNRFIMMNDTMSAGKRSMILCTNTSTDGLLIQAGNDSGTFVRNVAVFENDGNVGIGTTSPGSSLYVNSDVANNDDNHAAVIIDGCNNGLDGGLLVNSYQPRIVLNDRSTPGEWFDLRVSTDAFYIGNGSNTNLFSRTNIFLTIDGDGQVGIGTVSPAAPLHTYTTQTGGSGSKEVARFMVNTTGTERGIALYGTDNVGSGNEIRVQGTASPLHFVNNAGTKNVTIEDAGNVGIGTASPPKKLTVFGTGAGNAIVQIEGESGADPYINFLANNTQHWSLGIDDSDSDKFKISEHSALGTNDYFTVDTSGKVGIGTDSPDGTLHVYTATAGAVTANADADELIVENSGNCGISLLSPNNAICSIYFGDQNSDEEGSIKYDHSANSLGFHTNVRVDATARIHIDGLGKVGIGTDSPEHHLHISKPGSAVISLEDTSASNVHTWIIDDNDNFHIQSRDSSATFIANDYWITRDASGATQHQWCIGNSAKMTIDGDGDVGIGTTSPACQLHLNDDTDHAGIKIDAANTKNSYIDFLENGTNRANIYWGGASDVFIINHQGTNTAINDNGGKVGIGTASPGSSLYVNSDVANNDDNHAAVIIDGCNNGLDGGLLVNSYQPRIVLNDRSSSSEWFDLHVSTDTFYIGNGSNANLFSRTNTFLTIDGDGNVGIGTTSPQNLLHLRSPSSTTLQIDNSGATNDYLRLLVESSTKSLLFHRHIDGEASFDFGVEASNGTSNAFFRFFRGTNTTGSKYVEFLEGKGTNTPHARIGVDGGDSYFQIGGGNVGIGTDSPEHHLHISKPGSAVISLEDTSASNVHTWIIDDNDNFHIQSRDSSATFIANDYWITRDASGATQHQWRIGNSAKMTMDGDGDVGIGTDSPNVLLHVKSSSWANICIEATTNDAILQLTSDGSSSTNDWTMRLDTSDSDKLQWRYDNSAKMTLDTSGNVGIGTTSPGYKLEVAGDTYISTDFMCGKGISFGGTDAIPSPIWQPDFIYDQTGESFFGTQGSYAAGWSWNGYRSNDPDNGDWTVIGAGTGFTVYSYIRQCNDGIQFCISDAGSTGNNKGAPGIRMAIDEDGQVGIGTASPGYKLEVVGDIAINGTNQILADDSSSGASLPAFSFIGNENTGIFQVSTNVIGFACNGLQRMQIASTTGAVSIGTTSTTRRFQASVADASNHVAYFSNTGGNTNRWGLGILCGNTGSAGTIQFIDFFYSDATDAGGIASTAGGTPFFQAPSDERIKTDISPTKVNALEILNNLPLKEYRKIKSSVSSTKIKSNAPLIPIGWVAQDVERIIPSMVSESEVDGTKRVGDTNLIPYLVKAVQELSQKLEEANERIVALEQKE